MMNSGYTPISYRDEEDAHFPSMASASRDLSQSLVLPSPEQQHAMTATGAPSISLLQVVAPATLPEGYTFKASVGGGRTVSVQVPVGGVEQGQKFEVPFPKELGASTLSGVSVPVGHWRDGFFCLWNYGCCHPSFWTACCCHLLAAGQVISRLKLTALGRVGNATQAARAFPIILAIVFAYYTLYFILSFALGFMDPNQYSESPYSPPPIPPTRSMMNLINFISGMHYFYWFLSTFVLFNVRNYVRTKYAIPPSTAALCNAASSPSSLVGAIEDGCFSCWCPCFVAGQMLRHTTDYDVYPSTCCTVRGIPAYAPSIV